MMELVVESVGMKLVGRSDDLCYELWERKPVKSKETGETRDAWVFTGSYPSTVAHGMSMMLERAGNKNPDAFTLREALDLFRGMTADILAAEWSKS